MIGLNVTLDLPAGTCRVPNIVLAIAKDLRLPAGAELLPGRCQQPRPDEVTERIPLLGRTVGDALTLMAKVDPRYRVVESEGILVVRPLAAWSNEKHFLHMTLERFELKDGNIGGALDALLAPLKGSSGNGALLMSGVGSITLSLGPISMVDALDAIVRQHGQASWQVRYCVDEVAPDVGIVNLSTYDDRGIGTSFVPLRNGPDGKPMPCPQF